MDREQRIQATGKQLIEQASREAESAAKIERWLSGFIQRIMENEKFSNLSHLVKLLIGAVSLVVFIFASAHFYNRMILNNKRMPKVT